MSLDLEAIRARAESATPGPWQWFGNTDVHSVYLATRRWGQQFVMQFRRWGMASAQPVFCEGRTWRDTPEGMKDFNFGAGSGMTPAKDLARYVVAPDATSRADERVYRADVAGLRNPDAEFIAAARQDVDDLLAEVDRLRALVGETP